MSPYIRFGAARRDTGALFPVTIPLFPARVGRKKATAGGNAADKALSAMRDGGRAAFPNGVEPEPSARSGVTIQSYDGMPDRQAIENLNRLIESSDRIGPAG